MIYTASLDKLAKAITYGIIFLFTSIIAAEFSMLNNQSLIIPIVTFILFISIIVITYAYRPVRYELANEALIIKRPLADVAIPISEIESAESLQKDSMSNTIRTFGVGGLFGYFGKFYNRKIGKMTWYATQRKNYILITTSSNNKLVITPDEPQKLLADLVERLKVKNNHSA